MVHAISDGMVDGMVGSNEAIAMTCIVGLRFTLSKSVMHCQAVAVVAIAVQALGAPVWVANPSGVHPEGGVELSIGQGEEEEEENCHGGSQAQSYYAWVMEGRFYTPQG